MIMSQAQGIQSSKQLKPIYWLNDSPLKLGINKEKFLKVPNTIAYLGPEGTFSQVAAIKHFGISSELQSCSTIEDVFALVESEQARYGIVPIENSTEGTVNLSLIHISEPTRPY